MTVQLSAPQPSAARQVPVQLHGQSGLSYIVQRSTNLLSPNWTTLSTNQAGSGSINFTDQNATLNPGFYRVGRLPNP